ncbi:MAG: hypothetical protein LCH41_04720 [Armatimonadetes bacterium]|nr:hypothetical protein [Armatimonadota bacterium]
MPIRWATGTGCNGEVRGAYRCYGAHSALDPESFTQVLLETMHGLALGVLEFLASLILGT